MRMAPIVACALLLTGVGRAQWLDLDPPAPPGLGQESAAFALAESLSEQARSIETRGRGDTSADEAARLGAGAKGAFRRLAGALLRAGAARSGVGADAPVSGALRIVHALPGLDRLADSARDAAVPESVRAAILVRLRAFLAAADRFDPQSVPDWPTLDVSLAALFGELADAEAILDSRGVRSAWPMDPASAPSPDVGALRRALGELGWAGDAVAALSGLLDTLERAEAAPTLSPAADDTLTMLARAFEAARLLPAPGMLSETGTEALADRLEEACAGLAEPGARRAARARLEGAVLLAEVSASAREASAAGADETALRDLVRAAAARLEPEALTNDDRRALGALRAFLDRAAWSRPRLRRESWPRDETRGAWGALAPVVRAAESAGAAELLTALRDPRAMQRPAVISALVHHRESVEALRRLERVTGLLASLAARGDEASRRATEGVRRLVRAHEDEAQRAWAVRQLARFEEQWRRFGETPPVPADAPAGFDEELHRLEAEWLTAWADGEPADEAERLAPWANLLRLHADAALLTEGAGGPLLDAWGATAGSGAALRAEAARRLADWPRVAESALRAEPARRAMIVDEAARTWAPTSAAGALARGLRVAWPDGPPPGLVGALASPPSARAWMSPHRDDLAALARWAMELEGAEARVNTGRAEDIRAFLAPIGARLSEGVGASRTTAMLTP